VEAGSLLATQGDLAAAQAAYMKAVDLAPHDPAYLRLLAGFCLKYDNQVRELALPAARRAVAMGPEDPANLDLMAQVLLELNDLLNARRFLQRALQAQEDFPLAHLHLGQLYLASGDLPAAEKELSLARSLAPGSPAAGHAQRLLQSYFP
jgi:tetratricopeptide (TPR) repeat protein